MKATRIKMLSVLLVFVLAFSVLASCGGSESTAGKSEVKGNDKSAEPAKNEKLSLKIMSSIYNEPFDMKSAFWTKFQEKTNTNLDIEWVPINDYLTKVDLAIASGSLPDVLVMTQISRLSFVNAVNQGVFWDLGPLLGDFSKYPNLKQNIPASAWQLSKINGKTYGIPRTRPLINNAEFIRKDWFDKLGLPIPTTLDELYTSLKKIVESDPDGNGKKDTIGLVFDENWGSAFGTFDPNNTPDGGIYPEVLTDAYTNMIEWFSKAYKDGLMSKEFTSDGETQFKDTELINFFTGGKTAHFAKNPWHQYTYEQELQKVQPGAKVELVAGFKGPKGNTARVTPGFGGGLFIPKNVPEAKVKRILEFYNTIATDEYSNILRYGFEGIHYKVENGEIKPTDQGKKEVNNSTIEPFSLKDDPWLKTDAPTAPKEVNLKNHEKVKPILEVGKVRLSTIIQSDTWAQQWPKYEAEFKSMRTKAIIGKISVDEYKKYIDTMRNKSEFQKAYKEFADSYKSYFGK